MILLASSVSLGCMRELGLHDGVEGQGQPYTWAVPVTRAPYPLRPRCPDDSV